MISILCTAAVLGLSIDLTKKLSNTSVVGFIIFSLIVSGATLLIVILLLVRSTPRMDAITLFTLGIIWFISGITSTIGRSKACRLSSSNGASKKNCQEMEALMVFAWIVFGIFLVSFETLMILIYRTIAFGRPLIWNEDISRIAWFGTAPPPPLPATSGIEQVGVTPGFMEGAIATPNFATAEGVVAQQVPMTSAGQAFNPVAGGIYHQPNTQVIPAGGGVYGQQAPVTVTEIYPSSHHNRDHGHGHRHSSRDSSRHHRHHRRSSSSHRHDSKY